MKKYIFYSILSVLALTSCSDWLDVRSETEAKEEDLFSKKGGFRDALTGVYLTMVDRDAYGEKMTMSCVDELANIWYTPSSIRTSELGWYYLEQHDYTNEYAKEMVKAMYAKLFNTAVQANLLLKNIQENGGAIDDRQLRNVIEGEVYAIRAYVHLDILRLFGQMPQGGSVTVRLPYCETTSIDDIPSYYDFNAYVQKLETDLIQALDLLGQSDPALDTRLQDTNVSSDDIDDYLMYRRFRLNYWAVKALQARLYFYIGRSQQAHDLALEVINAKGRKDGELIAQLSSQGYLTSGRFALPGECLFALSKSDLLDYSVSMTIGGSTTRAEFSPVRQTPLVVTESMFNDLFAGVNTAANNRYLYVWNRSAHSSTGVVYPVIKKYWYDTTDDDVSDYATFYNLLIPMLRLSELYLVAIETTTSLDEANSLWDTYQRDHNVLLTEPAFSSLSEVQPEVQAEFLREFYGEGQMFYYYKSHGSTQMKWRVPAVDDSDYILPLPDTEFEPSK